MILSQTTAQKSEKKSHLIKDEESIILPIDKLAAIATSKACHPLLGAHLSIPIEG